MKSKEISRKAQVIAEYQTRLEQEKKKLKHIKYILNKLSSIKRIDTSSTKPVAFRKPRKAIKRRKIDWSSFTLDKLSSGKKLYSVSRLSDLALAQFHITKNNRPNVNRNLLKTLNQLTNTGILKITSFGSPSKEYYGKSEWFNGGEVKKVFKRRFE